ncbi:peptidoglycan-binding domain-containing protein [Actinophytocola xanthii]|uniref:Peptidoglycan binding-like domain-containing protein n=1 Tax=Actinophytocola xanthii TaxID=1912961 RepID=A0A1Q8CP81_9PSEU|nr:peptidoglycan-binding domain-containing protein [Actinophytocola xanthii]OLF16160.1 hypothetical protein BU204_18610 [Actinophytocola xanthii]
MTQSGQQAPPTLGPGQENPEEWVKYLQEMLNWYYQMQVVSQDGEFGAQTRNAVEHLRKQLRLPDGAEVDEQVWRAIGDSGSRGSGGSGGEHGRRGEGGEHGEHGEHGESDQDAEYDAGQDVGEGTDVPVSLLTADPEVSWAAAIAMVTSSAGNGQTVESVLEKSPQHNRTANEARQLATEQFGMSEKDCRGDRVESWAGLLRAHGALWVPVPDVDDHVVVVAGIGQNGGEAQVHVLDPRTGADEWADFGTFRDAYNMADGVDLKVLAAR